MMDAISLFFKPYDEGRQTIVTRGRDLHDFTVDDDGKITTLKWVIYHEALKRGLILLEYSRSNGLKYYDNDLTPEMIEDVDNVLNDTLGMSRTTPCSTDRDGEFVTFLRGLLNLIDLPSQQRFRDGKPWAFLVFIEYAEHSCPAMQPGYMQPEQQIAIELANSLSKSITIRSNGSYVVFSEVREGTLDELLTSNVEVVRLPQPDESEKLKFLSALQVKYKEVQREEGLTDEAITNITTLSSNRSIEQVFLGSYRTRKPVTARELARKKQEDIIRLSEGTLEAVNIDRFKSHNVVGRNSRRPLEILARTASNIKDGQSTSLRNLLLCGAPSTGKTHLATYSAHLAGIQAFILNSPKSSLVGESERKTRLMLSILRQQRGIGIIDELELVLPMNRDTGNDSGVSSNLLGQLQTFLSDTSLSGKVVLIGTSNKPGNISAAMLSRWTVIPVLMPLKEDYPAIIQEIINRLNRDLTAPDPNANGSVGSELLIDPTVLELTANRYFNAKCSPREILESLRSSWIDIKSKQFGEDHLDYASKAVIQRGDIESYIHADLMAIYHAGSAAFLPWWDPENQLPDPAYPYPDYISAILNSRGQIDRKKLVDSINQLSPHANV